MEDVVQIIIIAAVLAASVFALGRMMVKRLRGGCGCGSRPKAKRTDLTIEGKSSR